MRTPLCWLNWTGMDMHLFWLDHANNKQLFHYVDAEVAKIWTFQENSGISCLFISKLYFLHVNLVGVDLSILERSVCMLWFCCLLFQRYFRAFYILIKRKHIRLWNHLMCVTPRLIHHTYERVCLSVQIFSQIDVCDSFSSTVFAVNWVNS